MIKLLNMHCMDFMRECDDNAFDLAITDPPYFAAPKKLGFYGGRTSKEGVARNGYKKLGKWDVPGEDYFAELKRVSRHQIIWGINYFPIQNIGTGRIIWDKCNTGSTFSDCEIAYCSMTEHVRKYTYMWNGMLQGKSMIDGHIMQGNKRLNEKRIHPTQKPVILYKWLLSHFATAGNLILDTHLGSGSIAIACHDLGFDLTATEIDDEYCKAAMDRLENHTRQGVLF